MCETKFIGKSIKLFKTIDSTNSYAKKIAAEGCGNGTVIIAEEQTSGRGRMGKNWDSPGKMGIWMSVVLRPFLPPDSVQIITLGASVAVASAISKVTGIAPGIKWPNDLVLDRKKVCGILTEVNCENEKTNFLILGIGINVGQRPEDFPEELRSTAISIKSYIQDKRKGKVNFKRNHLIKALLFELERIYDMIINGRNAEIIEEWKKYSITLGREVRISSRDGEYTGMAVNITDGGSLVVECSDGTTREVFSGEVSVRGIMSYV
jgi:BirA family biotin operon repressor/biotin-[acetyl-CoA-carboxylase] ligase